jgi:hypothetical protein
LLLAAVLQPKDASGRIRWNMLAIWDDKRLLALPFRRKNFNRLVAIADGSVKKTALNSVVSGRLTAFKASTSSECRFFHFEMVAMATLKKSARPKGKDGHAECRKGG